MRTHTQQILDFCQRVAAAHHNKAGKRPRCAKGKGIYLGRQETNVESKRERKQKEQTEGMNRKSGGKNERPLQPVGTSMT